MPGRQPPVSALITCEHASRAVPRRWRALFAPHRDLLESHRGWDPGSLALGRALARRLQAPLLAGRATRLLVDLNRSAGHPKRFSEITAPLPAAERERIERDWWAPHWRAFRAELDRLPGRIVHIACHSFTPVLDGLVRETDVGLLYDPSRAGERQFALALAKAIGLRRPAWRVRMNRPYRGTANGIGQQHRRHCPDSRLVTLELEVSQAIVAAGRWPADRRALVAAAAEAVGTFGRACESG